MSLVLNAGADIPADPSAWRRLPIRLVSLTPPLQTLLPSRSLRPRRSSGGGVIVELDQRMRQLTSLFLHRRGTTLREDRSRPRRGRPLGFRMPFPAAACFGLSSRFSVDRRRGRVSHSERLRHLNKKVFDIAVCTPAARAAEMALRIDSAHDFSCFAFADSLRRFLLHAEHLLVPLMPVVLEVWNEFASRLDLMQRPICPTPMVRCFRG